ncbi:uncharacterized protein LOC111643505 [Copidosoma floridanum]|uniref:uncharacterized protein LOC111643505 n=1 Tax=Copidosoma floridanum TaxID=29053 RepID=UPI000C6FB032|nr:uncharacterized protein LOC111643505 [Copidosoma floridanum]
MKNSSSFELKQLISQTLRPLAALDNLEHAEHGLGDLFIGTVSNKLDYATAKDWQRHLGSSTDPSMLAQFKGFLNNHLISVESYIPKQKPSVAHPSPKQGKQKDATFVSASHQTTSTNLVCPCCNGEHHVRLCEIFKSKPWPIKKSIQSKAKLCHNCLDPHKFGDCRSTTLCAFCQQKHHTHRDSSSSQSQEKGVDPKNTTKAGKAPDAKVILDTSSACCSNTVLLATARIQIVSPSGKVLTARALVDPCSQASLISRSLVQMLGLKPQKTSAVLTELGGVVKANAIQLVTFKIKPNFESKFSLETSALVINRVSSYLPPAISQRVQLDCFKGIQLADPYFLNKDPIDLLLDAVTHATIIEGPIIKKGPNYPTAVKSSIDWLLSGAMSSLSTFQNQVVSLNICQEDNDSDLLQKFWQIEEPLSCKIILTKDEQICEKMFVENYTRDEAGHFTVSLPLKDSTDVLVASWEESFQLARAMFLHLESKFN